MSERICVVLVTHNRLALLRESLSALARSTTPIDQIIVVNNQSTDGTGEALATDFPQVTVITTAANVGSAGGYFLGIRAAHQHGFDWIWTFDDDSIVEPDALEQLLAARSRFSESHRPGLLASKVVWTDGSLHPMNIQKPKLYNADQQFLAAGCSTMSIRFTSFVSMLIHRSLIDRYGLPIAGYFLWNDDVEYSARILRNELGVLVPSSIVCHKTALKHVPATSSAEKFYFEVRNKLWIIRLSNAFAHDEKWWMFKSLLRRTWHHVCDNHFRLAVMRAVLKGLVDGLTHRPAPITQ
ncbi:glycosyltransferase family 2 protein [soil metagenome]